MPTDGVLRADVAVLDGTTDMVEINELNEASILYNLRLRYSRNQIYVRPRRPSPPFAAAAAAAASRRPMKMSHRLDFCRHSSGQR